MESLQRYSPPSMTPANEHRERLLADLVQRTASTALAMTLLVACGRGSAENANNRAAATLPPPTVSAALQAALAVPGITLELRWILDGGARSADTTYADPGTGERLALDDSVALDLDHVSEAIVNEDAFGATVALELTDAGAQQMLSTTTRHQGERIGVVLNGHLVTVATVRTPLFSMLPVVDGIPLAEAREIKDRINAVTSVTER